jgi:ABC-type transport system involved in multi-copper enzyme maturation permease subunit
MLSLEVGVTILVVHEVLSFLLFYTCFCRAVKMDHNTRKAVLLSFWLLSIASVLCIFAPLALAWEPDIVSVFLLFAIVVVQLVTSSYWRHGVPRDYVGASDEKQRSMARDTSALRRG